MATFRPRNTRRAKSLRNTPTDAERAMWSLLRGRGIGGAKFSRQIPVGPYFCDFLAREHRLIIEVDGGQHDQVIDRTRTSFLEAQGFRIIRFWNDDVLDNPEGVARKILSALPTPDPSRLREGDFGDVNVAAPLPPAGGTPVIPLPPAGGARGGPAPSDDGGSLP